MERNTRCIISIIESSDYQCPYCAEIAPVIDEILAEYKEKLLFVYRDFPLGTIHPHAFKAAEAANCAGEQSKYWEMHDLLFSNQIALNIDQFKEYATLLELDIPQFNRCLNIGRYENEILHDMQQGREYLVSSTPTFFVNGYRLVGADPQTLRWLINTILEQATQ